jgi:hypothetical protein
MSDDFVMKSNPKLDEVINNATNVEEMREAMLATLAAQGTIVRDRTDAYNTRVIAPRESQSAPAPTSQFKFEKEIRFHPESGKRTLVIRANTQEDLVALERQILGY